jgi:ribonuclease-3
LSRLAVLEQRLGHRFGDGRLLEQALTHRSHGPENNERLEFLGDGVLGCAVADLLFERFPHEAEGKLTRWRAELVRAESLAELGRRLGLDELIRASPATPLTQSIVADAMEAVFGALFVDAGYAAVRAATALALEPALAGLDPSGPAKDSKTRLQEVLQARRQRLPEYRVSSVRGAAHQQTFEVECVIADAGLSTTGRGSSRQRAEQEAATAMLKKVDA